MDSSVVAEFSLECKAGTCGTSWEEDPEEIPCENAALYTFRIEVEDEVGNWSDPSDVIGREVVRPGGT